mgnify:FL=1
MRTDLPVTGMTCQACVARVRRELLSVEGVEAVDVSLRRAQARITSSHALPSHLLTQAIEKAGYTVGAARDSWLNPDRRVWRDAALGLGLVMVVALALRLPIVAQVSASTGGAVAGGSILMVVVLGLVAGFSTCMAMVGGLVLAVTARAAQSAQEQGRQAGAWTRLEPQIAFHVGRLVSFVAFGAALGAVGSLVTLSGTALAVVMVVVAVVMGAVGLRLTELSPRLSRFSFALPARFAGWTAAGGSNGSGIWGALAAGAGSFFLPCGFTQAVQVYALSTGDAATSAAIMGLFAIGTMPGLLAVGGLTSLVRGPAGVRVFRMAGVVVLALAVVNISGASRILGIGMSAQEVAQDAVSANVTVAADGTQTISSVQGMYGYEPVNTTVIAGSPVRWEMYSEAVSCASYLLAPVAGIDPPQALAPGPNVFEFTPQESGTYLYTPEFGQVGVLEGGVGL